METLERKQVLVVEDDESMATFVTHVLTRWSVDVTHVTSAELALESVRTNAWDCLLTDVWLPGMSGLALTRHLREAGHRLAVAVMSAHEDPGIGAEAQAAGADTFLRKPFSPSTLRSAMQCLLHERPCPSPPEPA